MVGARPLCASPWRDARWLVLAPHADDETLGAGALIAQAAADDRLAGIVYLTDGAGSHPHPNAESRARLKAVRRTEARQACRILMGGGDAAPIFLDWPDADPAKPGSPAWSAAVRKLATVCRRTRTDAIAVTSRLEPHCDHAAAGALAWAVAMAALRPVTVFEYCVWGEPESGAMALSTRPMPSGRRRAALSAHRSQLTPLFGDGFRLPEAHRRMPDRDRLFLRSRHDPA